MNTETNHLFGTEPTRANTEASLRNVALPTQFRSIMPWTQFRAAFASVLLGTLAYWLWAVDQGPTGFAAFLALFAIAIRYGVPADERAQGRSNRVLQCVLVACMAIACARLAWQANPAVCVVGVLLLTLYAASVQRDGFGPVRMLCDVAMHVGVGLARWFSLPWGKVCQVVTGAPWPIISIGVPALVGLVFLLPLLQSDPELASRSYRWLADSLYRLQHWLLQWNVIATLSVVFVCVWSLGLFLPYRWAIRPPLLSPSNEAVCSTHWFIAAQNSLIAVCVVFVWFLLHEYQTMWFREFPESFRYSAYAHEGAAWLTLVLAMSTVFLSIVFQPSMQRHSKVQRLYWLSMAWSLCNAVLVLAVIHRLNIYIDYNGLTRMRIVAFVGVGCVVAGFLLVQYKLVYRESFVWLFRNELWALYAGIFLIAVMPMDAISHQWNATRVSAGNLRPSVQISHQPMSDEGLLRIVPLIEHPESVVREGVCGLLAERILKVPTAAPSEQKQDNFAGLQFLSDWRQFQASQYILERQLEHLRATLEPWVTDASKRLEAQNDFHVWSHRWY